MMEDKAMVTQTATPRRPGKRKTYAPAAAPAAEESGTTMEETGHAMAAFLDPSTRRAMVERAAYFRAERRGFAEGCALQDWLEAEAEIDAMLTR